MDEMEHRTECDRDQPSNRDNMLSGMVTELAVMHQERDAALAKFESLDRDCKVFEDAIAVARARSDSNVGVIISFSGCRNLGERLGRIADARGNIVSCHDAATVMLEAGVTTGKKEYLVSSIQRECNDHPELWEYVGPRTYRRIETVMDGASDAVE